MTQRERLEKQLKVWLDSRDFAQARKTMKIVADLRYQIEHERYLEKYGRTDRERG